MCPVHLPRPAMLGNGWCPTIQLGSRGWAPMTGTHRGLTSYGHEINRCYLMPEEWAPCPFSTAPSCHKRCPLQSQEACEGTPPPTDSVSQAPPIKNQISEETTGPDLSLTVLVTGPVCSKGDQSSSKKQSWQHFQARKNIWTLFWKAFAPLIICPKVLSWDISRAD